MLIDTNSKCHFTKLFKIIYIDHSANSTSKHVQQKRQHRVGNVNQVGEHRRRNVPDAGTLKGHSVAAKVSHHHEGGAHVHVVRVVIPGVGQLGAEAKCVVGDRFVLWESGRES